MSQHRSPFKGSLSPSVYTTGLVRGEAERSESGTTSVVIVATDGSGIRARLVYAGNGPRGERLLKGFELTFMAVEPSDLKKLSKYQSSEGPAGDLV